MGGTLRGRQHAHKTGASVVVYDNLASPRWPRDRSLSHACRARLIPTLLQRPLRTLWDANHVQRQPIMLYILVPPADQASLDGQCSAFAIWVCFPTSMLQFGIASQQFRRLLGNARNAPLLCMAADPSPQQVGLAILRPEMPRDVGGHLDAKAKSECKVEAQSDCVPSTEYAMTMFAHFEVLGIDLW